MSKSTFTETVDALRGEYARAEAMCESRALDLKQVARGSASRKRRRRFVVGTAALGAAACAASVGIALVDIGSDGAGEPRPPQVVVLAPSDLNYFVSATAEDWARNADYVVEASVVSEAQTGVQRGPDGERSVGRTVELKTDQILWQREQPAHTLSSTFRLDAAGWAVQDGSNVPIAYEQTPRFEVGHSYVVALVWKPRACAEGDGVIPAHWIPLGPEAAVPADGGRLGYGESEGGDVEGRVDQTAPGSLERQLLGEETIAVRRVLNELEPRPRQVGVFPTPTC